MATQPRNQNEAPYEPERPESSKDRGDQLTKGLREGLSVGSYPEGRPSPEEEETTTPIRVPTPA